MLHQVGDLFELNVKLRCQKVNLLGAVHAELEGTRQRGRPKKRWREEVERDLKVLGVRIWRELVIDRDKWGGIVRQAKAHSGL